MAGSISETDLLRLQVAAFRVERDRAKLENSALLFENEKKRLAETYQIGPADTFDIQTGVITSVEEPE